MIRAASFLFVFVVLVGCSSAPRVGEPVVRMHDEIVVGGTLIHSGARVVLWTDPGGYDGYRVEKRFSPLEEADWDHAKNAIKTPNRYDSRATDPVLAEATRGGNWSKSQLEATVDQIVLHYDASGTSRQCFHTLHDLRGLSIHFMIDVDGTIYQTLDVKEKAWHATKSNARSIGIEIANIGAYSTDSPVLTRWYRRDEHGLVLTLPAELGDGGVRTPGFVARPRTSDFVQGEIHGERFLQADFTPQQYGSLACLLAALTSAVPSIPLEAPRDEKGVVLTRVMTEQEWKEFRGVLGHDHIQANKIDPGPALDWDALLAEARSRAGSRVGSSFYRSQPEQD